MNNHNPSKNRWILPDGVQEMLPPDAQAVENLRRKILQTYSNWGYDLVMPAMIEYIDSLLTGTAHSLDLKTFALVDQLSGKQMGVRSDMTPQVARIDAHLLADSERRQRVTRLCYCGHLLHAQGDGITSSRTPMQIGAEIFGNDTIAADVEVVSLMITTLHTAGLDSISIDIGHVGIFRNLVQNTHLDSDQENLLFDILQRKSVPELKTYLQQLPLDDELRDQFCQLALLNGDVSILDEARKVYAGCGDVLLHSLDHVQAVVESLQNKFPDTLIHCDLSELRGYDYHTGLVFSAFLPGQGKEIARGGRYDDVGEVFGNARPATGFSADLLNLYQLSGQSGVTEPAILAPNVDDAELEILIKDLRKNNQRVIVDLTDGACTARDQQCNKVLTRQNDGWVITQV
ncbi:MAG: ATP phosphoribosyltransferase regulatory subunit [Gammaproteobacteria bacterium]|nr:ATP phosphoribosyltransferase regulatory subunit [Gammaproteobacteria bacterium]